MNFNYLYLFQSLNRCSWWKTRVTLLRFVQVSAFANIYLLDNYVQDFRKILFHMLKDPQLEVRLAASDTLSGFINCGYIPVDNELMVFYLYVYLAVFKLQEMSYDLANSNDLLNKHAGVLALSAVILAFPYTVPNFIPYVLMKFCRFASEKQPIHVSMMTLNRELCCDSSSRSRRRFLSSNVLTR